MQDHPAPLEVTTIQTCVHLLQNLQIEFQVSIEALTRNSLAEFELSLWKQEMLCGRLARVAVAMSRLDKAALNEVSEALTAVKHTAAVYGQVVQRCRRSTVILQELCSLYVNASRDVLKADFKPLCWEG